MKINISPNFPVQLGLSSFFGADDSKSSSEKNIDQQAWQREMERAQMDGWLDNPLTGSAQQAPDLSEDKVSRIEEGVMKQSPAPMVSSFMHLSLSVAGPLAMGNGVIDPASYAAISGGGERGAAQTAGANLEQRLTARIEQVLSVAAGKDGKASSLSAEVKAQIPGAVQSEPLSTSAERVLSSPRISLELIGDDARLWLGVSANDDLSEADLARIVNEARSMLAAEGVRLQDVMCNGKSLQLTAGDATPAEKKEAGAVIKLSNAKAARGGVPFYSYFEIQQET